MNTQHDRPTTPMRADGFPSDRRFATVPRASVGRGWILYRILRGSRG